MRRMFTVFAKLIGLLQIYWGFTYLASFSLFIGQIGNMGSTPAREYVIQMAGIFGFALLSFAMAWLLLTRTDWIADKLKILSDEQLPTLSADVALRAGFKVVAVYILVYSIPHLLVSVGSYGVWNDSLRLIWSAVLPPFLQVVFGLLLAIRTDWVLSLLSKGEKVEGWKIVVVGLAVLALFILLSRGLNNQPWFKYRTTYSSSESANVEYRDGDSDDALFLAKDTNTPAARDWYTVPYVKPATDDQLTLTNSGMTEIVDSLKDQSDKGPSATPAE